MADSFQIGVPDGTDIDPMNPLMIQRKIIHLRWGWPLIHDTLCRKKDLKSSHHIHIHFVAEIIGKPEIIHDKDWPSSISAHVSNTLIPMNMVTNYIL